MSDKGMCRLHGEFVLTEGCPECLAERHEGTGGPPPTVASTTPDNKGQEVLTLEKDTSADFTELAPVSTLALTHPDQDDLLIAFRDQALGLKQYAHDLVITTVDDLKPATDSLAIISKLKKAFDEKRKEYLQPFKEHIEAVNEAFKMLMEPILAADTMTRKKMFDFHVAQELIRRKQEESNRLKIEAAEAEMGLKGELSEPVNRIEVTKEAPKAVRTELGTAWMTDCWKYEVVDFALLPDEYKSVNTTLLNATTKANHDKKPVPGVRFYNEPFITVRG